MVREFEDNLLQRVFNWKNQHLHDFTVLAVKSGETVTRLVMRKEILTFDNEAVLEGGRKTVGIFSGT